MTRRFWIGVVLSAPVFVLAMWHMLQGDWSRWAQFVLSTPVVLWCGWRFFQRGWQSLVNRSPNMFTLIAMGVGCGLSLQRGRHVVARSFSSVVFGTRQNRHLLRGGGDHYGAGAVGGRFVRKLKERPRHTSWDSGLQWRKLGLYRNPRERGDPGDCLRDAELKLSKKNQNSFTFAHLLSP
jgi:hypothetical protein